MTTTPLSPRVRVLEAAKDAVARRMRADADLLATAADWALLHPVSEAEDAAGWCFGEDLIPLAGEGAPWVAEFAPAELAAVLGWKTETVAELMGDALELAARLPHIYRDIQELRLSVPLGRYLAEQTRDLSMDGARRVDKMLRGGGKLTRPFIRKVVDEVRLYEDPDRAAAEEEQALASRRVEVRPGRTPATLELVGDLDVADGVAFDQALSRVATVLGELGDGEGFEVRRARAVGILADPETALALLNRDRGTTGESTGRAGRAELVLTMDLATLADLATRGVIGPVDAGRYGTATTDLVKAWVTDWLGVDTRIVVRPVLDLTDPTTVAAVDGHDPPDPMAWYVRLRDPVCVFPGCTRTSRDCDLDHIEAYLPIAEGGPPGQTHPDNLAPLCRRHHRVKTHARWTYHRLPDDGYQWTTPTGRVIDTPPPRRYRR
jgi:hypothetical protein